MPPRRRSLEQIEKDSRAVDLRRHNLTYAQIAAQLGMRSPASAYEAVQRGLVQAIREPADHLRNLNLERLDEMSRVAWRIMYATHYVVSSSGKVVTHPETGHPLIDDGPALAALDRLLKIQERQNRQQGLDAPVKAEVRHVDNFDADIARLVAELATRGQGPAAGHPEVLDVAGEGQT